MFQSRRWHLREYFDSAEAALHACIRDDDIPRLQQLLRASPAPDLGHAEAGMGSPLHFAANWGSLAAVDALLDAGADALAVSTGEDRSPPISLAVRMGHRDVFHRLWRHAAPESHASYKLPTQTCLVAAASYGEVCLAGEMLDWWDGWSQALKDEALGWAARRWHFYVVDILLTRVSYGQSILDDALRYASDYRFEFHAEPLGRYDGIDYIHQQQMIARLIDAGANPNISQHHQPLTTNAACSANLTGALKVLLEKGSDPKAASSDGKTALHFLASPVWVRHCDPFTSRLNETGIRLLLQHGASVCQRDDAGDGPIHWAAYGSDLRIFRVFLSSCQDQDAVQGMKNHYGESLLHFAAAGCKVDILEFLLSRGLDVNHRNSNGWSPLMCALAPTHRDSFKDTRLKKASDAIRAARLLLSHGADPLVTTDESWTPLHCLALHHGHDKEGEAAQLASDFISRGADIEARAPLLVDEGGSASLASFGIPWGYRVQAAMDGAAADERPPRRRQVVKPGLTPLYWAAEHGAVGVVKALLKHGAELSPTDPADITPARTAAESKLLERLPDLVEEIIKLLVSAGGGY